MGYRALVWLLSDNAKALYGLKRSPPHQAAVFALSACRSEAPNAYAVQEGGRLARTDLIVTTMLLLGFAVTACAPQAFGPRDGTTAERPIRPSVLRVAIPQPIPQFSVRLGPYTPIIHQLVDGFLAKTDE